MTRNQIIKALQIGRMNMQAVVDASRDEVEIFIDNGEGKADEKKTAEAVKQAQSILGWMGGYYTGYGSMVLRKSGIDFGDWNDVSSRHHY
jgi:hypothetical protein